MVFATLEMGELEGIFEIKLEKLEFPSGVCNCFLTDELFNGVLTNAGTSAVCEVEGCKGVLETVGWVLDGELAILAASFFFASS